MLAVLFFPAGPVASAHPLLSAGLVLSLFLVAAIDIATMRLPDLITLPLILAGLLFSLIIDINEPVSAALGAVAGYLLIAMLRHVWLRWKRVEGIGLGDAKLLAALGAWTGLAGLPVILLLASATGLVLSVCIALISGRPLHLTRIPFGPFLAFGGWATWWIGIGDYFLH